MGKPLDGDSLLRWTACRLLKKKNLAVKVNEVVLHATVATLIHSMEAAMEADARPTNSAVASLVPSKRPRTEHNEFGLPLPVGAQPSRRSTLAASNHCSPIQNL
jgi:hypothetical protein